MARDLLSDLDAAKVQNLRAQIGLLKRASKFYAEKLRGVEPDTIQSIQDLARLPYTTNEEVKAAGRFGLLLEGAKPEAYFESSGTTGFPTSGFPDLSAEKAKSFGEFLDRWMGLRNAQVSRALVSLAFEMNPTGIRFQMALPYAGVTVIPCGVRSTICPPEKVLSLIRDLEPDAIFGRPFEVLRMADALRQMGGRTEDTSIRKIFVLGEPISKSKWRRMREAWDEADLYAHYGLTEVDTGLHTCSSGFYHAPESPFAHFSLIDDELHPVERDDVRGEMVISVLKRAHAPLINYRTGDVALRPRGRCPCGSPHPRFEIIGRQSDALRIGDRLVFPVEIEDEVLAMDDVGNEYAFVIREDGGLHLQLERAISSTVLLETIESNVRARVGVRFGVDVQVSVSPYSAIADKLGIAKKKGGRFTDLRGLSDEDRENELRINVVDSHQLRSGSGIPISI